MREGWEIKKLGDICSSFSGYTPSADLLNDKGRYPYFKVAEMNRPENLKVMSSTDAFIDNPTKVYRKGAIVFPKNGAAISTNKKRVLGQDSVVDLNTGGFLADQKHITEFFLYYLMQHIDFKQYVRRGAVPTLDIKELKERKCKVPPVQEQEKIVAELDCLSGIIEKKKQQLKELNNLAQSIFYDMFGDPIANEKGWEVKKLGEEFDVASGGTPSTKEQSYWDNGNIPWIGSNMCQNKVIYNNDGQFITKAGLEHSSARYFYKGYVLVALVGATIGKTALLQFDTTTNQNIAGISVPANKKYTSFFIFYLIQGLYGYFENIGEGKFKMANLSFVRALPIITPPLDLQNKFAQKIEAIEKQKELIKKSIQEAETLFNSRMDYWFN